MATYFSILSGSSTSFMQMDVEKDISQQAVFLYELA